MTATTGAAYAQRGEQAASLKVTSACIVCTFCCYETPGLTLENQLPRVLCSVVADVFLSPADHPRSLASQVRILSWRQLMKLSKMVRTSLPAPGSYPYQYIDEVWLYAHADGMLVLFVRLRPSLWWRRRCVTS